MEEDYPFRSVRREERLKIVPEGSSKLEVRDRLGGDGIEYRSEARTMALTQCGNLQEIYDFVKGKKPFSPSQLLVTIEQFDPGNRFGKYSYLACQYHGKYMCRRAVNPEQNGNTPARHMYGMKSAAETSQGEDAHVCGEWGSQRAWMFHVRCSDKSILFRDTRLMPKCIVFQAGDMIFGMSAAESGQRPLPDQAMLLENAMKGQWLLTFQLNGSPRKRTSLDKSKKADILVSSARRPVLSAPPRVLFGAQPSSSSSKLPASDEGCEDNISSTIVVSSDDDCEDSESTFIEVDRAAQKLTVAQNQLKQKLLQVGIRLAMLKMFF
ncbi:hypothetical protein R1sor_009086 [Riccia sorocarpa]|uniref:Uncharacterized protein n=1 Tax=Riccia sorocarpa TaxID=122646 RepID=A0ABD3H7I3_9MARC